MFDRWSVREDPGIKHLRLLSGYSWPVILLAVLVILGLWTAVVFQISYDYDRTVAENSQETMNVARAFEEYVRRVVESADEDLANLRDTYTQYGIQSPIFSVYSRHVANDPARAVFIVINEQGVAITGSLPNIEGMDYSDRDYFQFQRSAANDILYIGRPLVGKVGGQVTIPISRGILNADGSFGGVVYISLKVNYFLKFYEKINLGKDQLIFLTGTDGVVRARQSGSQLDSGQDVRKGETYRRVQAGELFGTHISENVLDGITRITSFRVMPDYPLTVAVGKSKSVAMEAFERRKQNYLSSTLAASIFIFCFCVLLGNRDRKLRLQKQELMAVNQKLAASMEQYQELAAELQQHQDNLQELVKEQVHEIYAMHDELSAIFRSISDPFYILDRRWRFTHINQEAAIAIGRLNKTLIGECIWEVFPELIGTELHQKYTDTMETNTSHDLIMQSEFNDKTFQVYLNPYPNGMLVYFRDITKQKNYEAELHRLDRLNIVGEMAASIGHEIRNPLTTVRGYLQMFLLKGKYEEHKSQISTMIEELDRANAIITEYLSLAKNKTVSLKQGNINHILHTLFPLLQAEAHRQGHTLRMSTQDVPAVWLDDNEIRQFILNIVRNGFDAMKPGGCLTLQTCMEQEKVVVSISDTGRGIPQEIQEKLGTPFLTTKESGTGLGLAVCYRIAERHNAKLSYRTSEQGTTFFLEFPST